MSSDEGKESGEQFTVEVFEAPSVNPEIIQFNGELVDTYKVPQYDERPNFESRAYLFKTAKGYRVYHAGRDFFRLGQSEYGMLHPYEADTRTGSRVYLDYSSVEEAAREWVRFTSTAVEIVETRWARIAGARNLKQAAAPPPAEESRSSWWTRLLRR
jgi:hypothetical protein